MPRLALVLVALPSLLCCAPTSANSQPVSIIYGYDAQTHVGIKRLEIAPDPEQETIHQQLWRSDDPMKIGKLAITGDDRWVGMGVVGPFPAVVIVPSRPTAPVPVPGEARVESRLVRIGDEVESIIASRKRLIVADDSGVLMVIEPESGEVSGRFETRRQLDPIGHKIEEMTISPCGGFVMCTFQKDSRDGRRRGSRVLILRYPTLEKVYDIQLPRDRPHLHNPNNPAEQGPNPELILLCPVENRMVLSLDLYGAMAFADLDQVLEAGKLVNYTVVSSDIKDRWGDAFPDRARLYRVGDRTLMWVANSGAAGGAVVMDLKTRTVVARYRTHPGLEPTVRMPGTDILVAAGRGKIKTRQQARVLREFEDIGHIYVFDLASLDAQAIVEPRRIEFESVPTFAVGGLDGQRVMVLTGDDAPDQFVELNIQTGAKGRIIKAPGIVGRWQPIPATEKASAKPEDQRPTVDTHGERR
ncbi:MAG: hypothetical protein JJU36_08750 [Phycisphaeraceae bacterium]|nr:hypothetical protein [Phycisphaeraceae bacterium]